MAWYLCSYYDNETLKNIGAVGIGVEGTTVALVCFLLVQRNVVYILREALGRSGKSVGRRVQNIGTLQTPVLQVYFREFQLISLLGRKSYVG